MIEYEDCPYCEKQTEINYEGVDEGVDFEQECANCNKDFICNYTQDISINTKTMEEGK